jgi:hypothetical protein
MVVSVNFSVYSSFFWRIRNLRHIHTFTLEFSRDYSERSNTNAEILMNRSMQPDYLNGKDKDNYEDKSSEFKKKLDNMLTPADIDATKVSANTQKRLSRV